MVAVKRKERTAVEGILDILPLLHINPIMEIADGPGDVVLSVGTEIVQYCFGVVAC